MHLFYYAQEKKSVFLCLFTNIQIKFWLLHKDKSEKHMSHFPEIVCDSPIYGAYTIVNHRDQLSAHFAKKQSGVYGVSLREM